MDDSKRITVCKECRHCRMDSYYGYICCVEEVIDPVLGKVAKVDAVCRNKNKGDCPDFAAKDAVRAGERCSGVFMEAVRKAFGLT